MTIAVQAMQGVVASKLRPQDVPRQTNVSRTKRRAGSPSDPAFSASAFAAPPFPARALMVAALLVAAIPAAYGQDATPAGGQSANPPSPPAPASGDATQGSQGAAAAQAATGAPATADADKSGKRPPVCFQLTGRCVELKKAPAAKGAANASKDGSSAKPPLNLAAPDVRTVVSADELKEPLPSNDQVTEVQEDQTVSVKGEGVPADVPLGFGAIWWALNHPTQAWRIVTPVE
jgi:hypothetical protein